MSIQAQIFLRSGEYKKIERLLLSIGLAKNELDSLLIKFSQREAEEKKLNEIKLKEYIENLEKQQIHYSEISNALLNYILKLQNMTSAFSGISGFALSDEKAFLALVKSIEEYNVIFNIMNNRRLEFKSAIKLYWLDDNASNNYIAIADYALDEIHKPYVLKLNDEITSINKVLRGHIRDDDERTILADNIKKNISIIISDLNIRIPILERRVHTFLEEISPEINLSIN